ncbi:unnamed protein product [Alopecurus aequalis]
MVRARKPQRAVLTSPGVLPYISSGLPKRKYDGFFPVVASHIAAANRKKRKVIHDRFMHQKGRWVHDRFIHRLKDAPFTSPLDPNWVGFTAEEVQILKGTTRMAHTLLSEIHEKSNQWTICVCVSRIWHYRGGTDHGAIRHTDLVLLDQEGNHMYGQIPPEPAGRFMSVLQEGMVYRIRKFFCNPSKPAWRPVKSPYMIQFTRYTVVEQVFHLEETYPFCTYSLTPFLELPKPSSTPARFVDVIGRITMVSDIVPIQAMHQTVASDMRTVVLQDLLGNEISITLWGERAVEFDADAVRAMGEKEPVVAIFVGTLPKMTHGTRSLSGSSACRWYIDEDVPDINAFQARVTPDKRWWFPSRGTCRKSARYDGGRYQCSNLNCPSAEPEITYCVSVMATDGTAEAEFVLFDKVAAGALNKPLSNLMMQLYPGHATIQEAAYAARFDNVIPPEISRLVGQKYKFMVSISKKSQFTNMDSLSFSVNRIETTFNPELPATVFGRASVLGSSSSLGHAASGSVPIENPSPSTSQLPAPQAAILTPGKSSQGVVRGARHSLFFPSPSKEKVQPEAAVASGEGSSMVAVSEAVQTNAVTAVVQPVETDASSTSPLVAGTVLPAIVASYQTPAEIPEPIIGFKNKRVAGGGKGGNTLKKQK